MHLFQVMSVGEMLVFAITSVRINVVVLLLRNMKMY